VSFFQILAITVYLFIKRLSEPFDPEKTYII
jgi:hypothetical protein